MTTTRVENPFRPGAGHRPPYLAGRAHEQNAVRKLLDQKVILENIVLTGLRGVGKTVLLEALKPIAVEKKWLWAGNDLSESASITESHLATRIIADVAVITSPLLIGETIRQEMGFMGAQTVTQECVNYDFLKRYFDSVPGLISDKLKATLEFVWMAMSMSTSDIAGIVFAYDEAQNLTDHVPANEYPLSLLIEVFQSLQKKNIPFLLLLTGLPTLFPKLVESRTYAERMFHVLFLQQLSDVDSTQAIIKPTEHSPLKFAPKDIERIVELSGGYPYFIQFICKEIYDIWITKMKADEVPMALLDDIIRKLDTDFFQGRWAKATDRQRDLLLLIANLPNCDGEFTVQDLAQISQPGIKSFSAAHINQIFASLSAIGMIYKHRHGKYSLAVPLFSGFLKRQLREHNANPDA
jgi:hypothetical protein